MGFNAFLGDFGQGLASGIAKRFDEADKERLQKKQDAYSDQRRMQQAAQVQDILTNLQNTPGWKSLPLRDQINLYNQALIAFPEASKRITGDAIATYKAENPGKTLDLYAGKTPETKVEETAELFTGLGFNPEEAQTHAGIYHTLNAGARTAYMKAVIDAWKRKDKMPQAGQYQDPQAGQSQMPQETVIDAQVQPQATQQMQQPAVVEEKVFEYPTVNDLFDNTTPQERFKREERFGRENYKVIQDLNKKVKAVDDELLYIKQLKNLENSGKLPKFLGRLLINPKTGEVYYPGSINKETQLFVKIINDFTTKAKDSFGANVTNFDLATFMNRLPSLANSSDGRRLIYDQMQTINEINKLHSQSIRDVYKHYGANKINEERATAIAKEKSKKDKEKLLKKYDTVLDAVDIYEAKSDEEDHAGEVLIKHKGRLGWVPKEKITIFEKQGAIRV